MKGKFWYNRFVRAVVEIIFIILLMTVIVITGIGSEVYTSGMISDSEGFHTSRIMEQTIADYAEQAARYMYLYVEEEYISDEEKITKNEEETVENNEDKNVDNNNNEEYHTVIVYYPGTDDESEFYYRSQDITSAIKSETLQNKLTNSMDRICKNYAFRIRYNDEILYSNVEKEEDYEFINHSVCYLEDVDSKTSEGQYLFIDNYVRKNIVEGDDFYKCQKWYHFFQDNMTTILLLAVAAVLLIIMLGIYIVLTAGYNQEGELEAGWLDMIPLELYIIVTILYMFFCATLVSSGDWIDVLICGIAIMLLLLLIDVKTIISRLRNRVFMKNSILGKISIIFVGAVRKVFVDIDKKWKAVLYIGSIFFCEAFAIFLCATIFYSGVMGIFAWIIMKVIQFILLMCIYTNIADIQKGVKQMCEGHTDIKIDTTKMNGIFRSTAEYINDISNGLDKAVEEKMKSEQLKTELITNVSHDIKTPLTSIINYIDLMKKEDIANETVKEYLAVVDKQSMRLKKLTEDVIEASKAATGNVKVEAVRLNISEMIVQSLGEYTGKFAEKDLEVLYSETEKPEYVLADGRLLWRVVENLFSNVYKYALEGTRFYIDIQEDSEYIRITMKNISKYQLNISSDELMQRFVRGDSSRSAGGNGLGLSIAKSLTKLQSGTLDIQINGDLFISILNLRKAGSEEEE